MTLRDRRLTDPAEIAACAAFAAAFDRAKPKISKVKLAESLGVTPALVSHWYNARAAIPAERAKEVAAIVDADPADISAGWRAWKARMPVSQSARLDPQKMAEALVAVLRMQERDGRVFKPKQTAIALCRVYEVRDMYPANMTRADLSAFDNMVQAALNRAREQDGQESDGRVAAGSGERNSQSAAKRKRA